MSLWWTLTEITLLVQTLTSVVLNLLSYFIWSFGDIHLVWDFICLMALFNNEVCLTICVLLNDQWGSTRWSIILLCYSASSCWDTESAIHKNRGWKLIDATCITLGRINFFIDCIKSIRWGVDAYFKVCSSIRIKPRWN